MTRRLPTTLRLCCHRRALSTEPPPKAADAASSISVNPTPTENSTAGQTDFNGFTRKRQMKKSNLAIKAGVPNYMATLKSSLSALPSGLVNPLLGPTDDLFPDLRECLLKASDNTVDLGSQEAFPYPLDRVQLEEIRAVTRGFLAQPSSLPRIITLTYAEAMGEGMLEQVAMGLGKDCEADCFTFHARDFGGILEGCARSWYGRPYFSAAQGSALVKQQPSQRIIDEDDLELAEEPESSERWLSGFLKRQPIRKHGSNSNNPQSVANLDAKIKETVNLYSVLDFLSQCMDRAGCHKPRIIHLSGFGASLANPLHRNHLLRFVQETNSAGRTCLVLVSENNPKADYAPPEEYQSNSGSNPNGGNSTTMPLGLASYLLTKGRCERLAEIPNTPEYDANWLLDRTAFGGLRFFLVPPKDPKKRTELHALLEKEHQERVRAFNARRLSDVLEQLGIPQEGLSPQDSCLQLERSPLLLSEAIYLAYMAAASEGSASKVTSSSLRTALQKYSETRALHKAHYTQASPHAAQNHRLDVKTMSKYEKRLLPCIVTADMVKTRFEEIGSHDRVKRSLYELITLPLDRPELFSTGILREAVSGILLFGPPGTGKTMLAKAVAAQSKSNFIAVNSSNIYDMYVGEGEKNVKALFKLARRLSPCIIFIDEVDAILDARSNAVGKASRVEILNEFMAEWDGLLSASADARVMVLAATNRPFALDDAVLRRLPRRILVDLPDHKARLQILNILLRSDRLAPDLDLEIIAGPMTRNYSGSDLKNLCISAAMASLRRSIAAADREPPCLTLADFQAACQEVPASISDSMDTLLELRKWDQTFGEGRKQGATKSFGFTPS